MSSPSLDLRPHRPVIEPARVDALRRRVFGCAGSWPEIPGYELEAELGRGAFGRVYRAFDPRFQRHVALKVVPVDSPEARVRVEREAHALARLSHPHVVQVYDKGPAGEHGYFLALEYIDGVDLQQWLAQQPRSLPAILATFLQIAEGLAAAHRAGLVHRDLKPANVVVGLDGRVRVLDFGLARALDDSSLTNTDELMRPHEPVGGDEGCARLEQLARPVTSRGHFVGTPSYAAPEQHLGEADARSDQFSFCVALFEAVYGRRPLPLRRGVDPGAQLRTQAIDFRPGERRIPRWLVAMLRQGLALEPRRRHADMGVIVRELRSRLHTRPARRHATWLAAAAAMLTACVMLLTGQLDSEAESCRKAREALPVEWLAHRQVVEPRLPALGAELDAWAERWRDGRRAACSVPTPARRAEIDACLDASAGALGQLAREPAAASPAAWQQLHAHPGPRPLAGLVEVLPDPTRCVTGGEPRAEPAAREAWEQLVRARLALAGGDLVAAGRASARAVERSRELGDRARLVVAEYQQLLLDARRGEPRELAHALSLLVRALELGERPLAADIAATSLTLRSLGTLRAGPSRASTTPPELVGRLANELAALRASRAIDAREAPAVAGWLALAEGHARLVLGDAPLAETLYHDARRRFDQAGPAVPRSLVALAELNEANAMSLRSPPAAAAGALAGSALEARRAALGSTTPQSAHETRVLGEILVRLGDIDGALRRYAEADALLVALDLPLERAFLRAEVAHAHWLAARRARAALHQAKLDGRDPEPARTELERRRHLALREVLDLERLAGPLRLAAAPRAHAREQARVWAVSMATYGYHHGCWDRMLAAGERLAAACEHLEGSEPSCVAGQRQRQGLLEQGAAARATAEGCVPHPDVR
jgi:serine/threonine protein kinase